LLSARRCTIKSWINGGDWAWRSYRDRGDGCKGDKTLLGEDINQPGGMANDPKMNGGGV
jgi:hypothetical protein